MIYSGRIPYGTNQVESSSLAITVENTDVAVFTTGSLLVSGSLTSLGGFTGSFSGSFTGSANFTTLTSSNALITGNVIVLGTASINTLVINQTQLSTGSNQLGDNADDFQTLFGTVRIPTGSLTVTGSTIISSSAATQLQVGSNSLFVSSSGNVGIGTTTPGSGESGNYLLDVNGNALIRSQLRFLAPNTPTTVIQFKGISGGGAYDIQGGDYGSHNDVTRIRFQNTGIHWQGIMSFWTKDANTVTITERLRINEYGFIGIGTTTPTHRLDVSGSGRFSGNLTISGSATNSLLVRGSGATSATTSLLVQNANASSSLVVLDNGFVGINTGSAGAYLDVSATGNTAGFRITHTDNNFVTFTRGASSIYFGANSGIWQFTTVLPSALGSASPIIGISGKTIGINQNPTSGFTLAISGSQFIQTGSLAIGTTSTGSALTVYKSGSTVVSIQGSQGELFSITDSLSGSLFSVSNISGLPILEVFSDNTTLVGNYLDPMLVTTQLVTANSGSTTIYSLPTASYDGAFYDYVVRSGSNSRAGQIMAIWSGSSVNYTDNSTTDFGSTANLSFNVIVSGSNMVLRSTVTTGSWTVKTIIRSI